MDYRKIIKEVGRGKNHARDLDQETAVAAQSTQANRVPRRLSELRL